MLPAQEAEAGVVGQVIQEDVNPVEEHLQIVRIQGVSQEQECAQIATTTSNGDKQQQAEELHITTIAKMMNAKRLFYPSPKIHLILSTYIIAMRHSIPKLPK